MNTTQINYFLAAAKSLNFTEASKKLYITQSAMSQQISQMEAELGMILFFRKKNKLELTPAGKVLLNELDSFMEHYDRIIDRAAAVNSGYVGYLSIGILNGHELGTEFIDKLQAFKEKHKQIGFEFHSGPLKKLREDTEQHKLDLIYTMAWDIRFEGKLCFREFKKDKTVFMVGKHHPLAGRHISSLADLKDETFVLPTDSQSLPGLENFIEIAKGTGFSPIIKGTSSMEEANLLVEAGEGVGMVSASSYLYGHPNFVEIGEVMTDNFVFAWDKDNTNPVVPQFVEFMCGGEKGE
ncbi:MAG: LysR family transcriptional regulator [Lachnospiraceae bacterium]|nr:LysR family transcriptional regulator [Lachnospiraceae bacterium]